jgi:hypothetical protein
MEMGTSKPLPLRHALHFSVSVKVISLPSLSSSLWQEGEETLVQSAIRLSRSILSRAVLSETGLSHWSETCRKRRAGALQKVAYSTFGKSIGGVYNYEEFLRCATIAVWG